MGRDSPSSTPQGAPRIPPGLNRTFELPRVALDSRVDRRPSGHQDDDQPGHPSTGHPFASQDACVSFVANGGTLVEAQAVWRAKEKERRLRAAAPMLASVRVGEYGPLDVGPTDAIGVGDGGNGRAEPHGSVKRPAFDWYGDAAEIFERLRDLPDGGGPEAIRSEFA